VRKDARQSLGYSNLGAGMGAVLNRSKPRSLLTAIVYRLSRLVPDSQTKLRILLDLEWIFERLSQEQASAHYGIDGSPWRKSTMEFISRHMTKADAVLDLGCGHGAISHSLSLIARKVVGVDYNRELIARARKKYATDNLQFIHDEALNYLGQCDEKFNVLVLTHVLEHLDRPKEFLAAYAGHFKHMFIEVPDFDRTFLNRFRQDLNIPQIYTDADHVTEFDRDELYALLSGLNLDVIDSECRYGVLRVWVECNRG
jgi:2-polyprenyl-3-methyl-5-hydroxy-6-metoxy-1,4-benzoquinol methylase